MTIETKIDTSSLSVLADQIKDHCCCGLGQTRIQGVPGEGNEHAEIVFVGEAPGFNEDQQGKPFVGNSGKFLDDMLANIKMSRSDVFITNIVKCRPPGNRDPEEDEKWACHFYLEAQLQLINPLLIVCLGRHSLNYFLPGLKISAVHGQVQKRGERKILPLYHPAAALHNGSLRSTLVDDFERIPAILEKMKQSAKPVEKSVVDKQMKLL